MQIGSSALTQYRLIEKNLDREMANFEKQQPQLKRDLAYFRENASKATSVDALLKDRRLLEVTLSAFQLEDQLNSKAILKKLMTENPDDKKSLAYRMLDPRFRQLAMAMKDLNGGKRPFDSKAFVETIAEGYKTNAFEKAAGESTPGLREALFFKRTVDGVDVMTKLGKINRVDTDLDVALGGVSLSVDRRYDSMSAQQDKPSFGPGWTFLGLEPRIETNVAATGREKDGVYNAFASTTRVALTLPTGERASFTFKPRVEKVDGVEYFRPAYVADGAHGWSLSSPDVRLTKRGDKFYEADSGRPYNPANPNMKGSDYTLAKPPGDLRMSLDATQPRFYLLDSKLGTTDIVAKNLSRLTVTANTIKAQSGETLTLTRDKQGRVTGVEAPGGKRVSYTYDEDGALTGVKASSGKTGSAYKYSEGVLVSAENLADKKTTTYASPVEKVSQILANRVLAQVARVATGLPDQLAALDYDQQKARMEKKLDFKDFKDPKKVDKFVEKFLVNNDLKNSGTVNPALSLLGGGSALNLLA